MVLLTIHHSHFRPRPSKTTQPATDSNSSSTATPPSTPPTPPHLTNPPPKPLRPPHPAPPNPPEPKPTPQQPPFRQIPPGKNHYATLNIAITATPPEIRQAYYAALAAIPNNDSNTDSESLHLQNVLDEALHILTHPYKKTIFDRAYTDELLDYHERCQKDRREVECNEPSNSKQQSSGAAKLEKWKASLMKGLKGEGEEEVFGRVGWAKVKARQAHFKLDKSFGGTVEETMLWAPSLFHGEVGGFDGWTG